MAGNPPVGAPYGTTKHWQVRDDSGWIMMAAPLSYQLTTQYDNHGKTGSVTLTHHWISQRDGKAKTTQYTFDLDQMNQRNHDSWKTRPIRYVSMLLLESGAPTGAPSGTAWQ